MMPVERGNRPASIDACPGAVSVIAFVAVFFPMFFGLMLGDVGYGAVLAILLHLYGTMKPRVAILSTGNEVVDPGQPLKPGHIYDINKFTLSAVLREHGIVAVFAANMVPTPPFAVPPLSESVKVTSAKPLAFAAGVNVGRMRLLVLVLFTVFVSTLEIAVSQYHLSPSRVV